MYSTNKFIQNIYQIYIIYLHIFDVLIHIFNVYSGEGNEVAKELDMTANKQQKLYINIHNC